MTLPLPPPLEQFIARRVDTAAAASVKTLLRGEIHRRASQYGTT
jgi:hypothetical protein